MKEKRGLNAPDTAGAVDTSGHDGLDQRTHILVLHCPAKHKHHYLSQLISRPKPSFKNIKLSDFGKNTARHITLCLKEPNGDSMI